MNTIIKLRKEEDTINLAKKLAPSLRSGDVVALFGELGVGKTFFTKHLCKFLDVTENVSSPSYVLMNEYSGKFPIFHFDFFRLDSKDELLELGLYDIFDKGLTIIEWPEIAENLLPEKTIRIEFLFAGSSRKARIVKKTNLILSDEIDLLELK